MSVNIQNLTSGTSASAGTSFSTASIATLDNDLRINK